MAWWMQGGAPNDACSVAWRSLWLPFVQRAVTVGGTAPPYGFSVAVSRAFGREEAPCALRAVVGCYEAPCLTSCRGRPRQKDEASDKDNALPRDETLQERARLTRLQESRRHFTSPPLTRESALVEQLLLEINSGPQRIMRVALCRKSTVDLTRTVAVL